MRGFLLLAVLQVSALACGGVQHVTKGKADPTFWEVCYNADGSIDDYDGECAFPKQIKWDGYVRVAIAPDYPAPTVVMQTIEVWNTWLGREVFIWVNHLDEHDVIVQYDPEVSFAAGMASHLMRYNKRPKFYVTLYGLYVYNTEVTVHEFGHVMGLAHDAGYPRSVMFPGRTYMPELTRTDCRALVNKYDLETPGCAL